MPGKTSRMGGFGLPAALALALLPAGVSTLSAAPVKAPPKTPATAKPAASPSAKAAALAQRGLKEGYSQLKRGKTKSAAATFGKLLANGGMSPSDTSRALLGRAQAYRKLKKSAQAIADYSNALWIRNGLSAADRSAAFRGRAQAYRMVGLTAQAQADVKSASQPATPKVTPPSAKKWALLPQPQTPKTVVPKTVTPKAQTPKTTVARKPAQQPRDAAKPQTVRATQPPAGSGWQPSTAPVAAGWGAVPSVPPAAGAASPSSGGSNFITGLFGNLFSGFGSSETPTPPATSAITTSAIPPAKSSIPAAAARPPTANPRIATAWAKGTAVKPTAKPTTAVRTPGGKEYVQLDNLPSQRAAEAMAEKISGRHAVLLASRRPIVEANVLPSYGTYYRVRIGPFRTASEGKVFCKQLRAKDTSFDCFSIAR